MEPKQMPAVIQQPKPLILEGDPEAQLQFAEEAAKALVKRIKPLTIGGREYVRISGWQMVGRFFGATIGMEWSKPIERNGKVIGYEARAVIHQHGNIIATAEAQCTREEKSWRGREEFALRAMAQTRAGSRAMRHAFGWVVELAGYASTPAEEMEEDSRTQIETLPEQQTGSSMEEAEKPKAEEGKITVDLLKSLLEKVSPATKLEFWHRAGFENFDELPISNYPKAAKWLRDQLPK